MTSFVSEAEVEGIPLCKMPARISLAVRREAAELCPACGEKETATEALIALANATGSKVVAAAYMTGILPIKKNGSQSAISDFREYSVLDPGVLPHSLALSSKRFARSSIPFCVAQGTRNSSRWYAVLTNCSRTHVSMN